MTRTIVALICSSTLLFVACGKNGDSGSKAPPPGDENADKMAADKKAADKKAADKKAADKKAADKKEEPKTEPAADPAATYAALEVGADYKTWDKLNKTSVKSKTHGGRFVDTYVNKVGVKAYKDGDADIPVGTIVVKTSWETKDDKPTDVAGPIFIMERRAGKGGGDASWWYGLHWEKVPEGWQSAIGGSQAYWRTPSEKVGYCSECHDNFPRELGGIPKAHRAY